MNYNNKLETAIIKAVEETDGLWTFNDYLFECNYSILYDVYDMEEVTGLDFEKVYNYFYYSIDELLYDTEYFTIDETYEDIIFINDTAKWFKEQLVWYNELQKMIDEGFISDEGRKALSLVIIKLYRGVYDE